MLESSIPDYCQYWWYTMRYLSSWGAIFCLSLSLGISGCSLLEVQFKSGVEPLPQEHLSMRVFTQEFASTFFIGIEQNADLILHTDDLQTKSNALMWKINAEQTLEQTIFQSSPVAAMIDTWTFVTQMTHFFETGNGKTLFGEQTQLAVNVSQQLLADYEHRMQGLMNETDFNTNQLFVREYAIAHPLFDITFSQEPAFNDWLSFRNIDELDAVTTFGSIPEVMSDMSERMAMFASQIPKILSWKTELFALHTSIDSKAVQQTLKDINETSTTFRKLMVERPQLMSELAVALRGELTPLLAQWDVSVDRNMTQLSGERQALERMVERERIALEKMVDRERQAVTKDADALVQRTVTQIFEELSGVIKSLLLYIVLFLIVVFFAPLCLGVWLGKRINLKQNSVAQ